jgi:hypothetical protein
MCCCLLNVIIFDGGLYQGEAVLIKMTSAPVFLKHVRNYATQACANRSPFRSLVIVIEVFPYMCKLKHLIFFSGLG